MVHLLAAASSTSNGEGGIPGWLTLGIAGYAAILSTVVFVNQFVRGRPGVKVRLRAVVVVRQSNGVNDYWTIRIVNHRERPIEIRAAGLSLANRTDLYPEFVDLEGHAVGTGEALFPLSLADGQSKDLTVRRNDEGEKVLKAWARDSLDRRYASRRQILWPHRRFKAWRARRNWEIAQKSP